MGSNPSATPAGGSVTTVPGEDAGPKPGGLEVRARVGRYVVLSVLGAGGMGIVYAAFDPDLDRKVALKLLHRSASSAVRGDASPRLLREAQAAARVRHPNVVTVHDVGQHEGDVFVAMEFVEGETLRDWMARSHDWREVLAILRDAGEGLRAAHAEGLVHRDFKPDNVMIDARGRVVVMDFGLARAAGSRSEDAPASDASLVDASLTRTGAIVGTPAYMAPEQHRGRDPDARVDQFSFCVTLYEALYGVRPFVGEDLPSLVTNITEGRVRAAPESTMVPRWLRSVVLVGLAPQPNDRHADMGALLTALARDPTRRRRWLVAGTTITALGVVAIGVAAYGDHLRSQACTEAAAAIDDSWNDKRRDALRAAFERNDVSVGREAWLRVESALDDFAIAWSAETEQACLAARDESTACLASQHATLAKLIDGMSALETATMHQAVRAAASLEQPSLCAEERYAARFAGEPDARSSEIVDLVDDERIARTLGRYDEAFRAAERAVELAETVDGDGLLARALAARAHSHESSGRSRDAEADYERAHFLARENADDHLAASTATRLVHVVGDRLKRYDEGLRWGRHARALVLQGDGRGSIDWALLSIAIGNVRAAAGDHASAVASIEEGLAIYRERFNERNPATASALNDLGIAQARSGDMTAAEASLREALVLREAGLGPRHPLVAVTRENLANVLIDLGQHDAALEQHRAALELKRATLGPHHPGYASSLYNLGGLLAEIERWDEGLVLLREALAIRERSLPAEHTDIALTHLTIARALHKAGRDAEARPELTIAIASLEAAGENDYLALARAALAELDAHE